MAGFRAPPPACRLVGISLGAAACGCRLVAALLAPPPICRLVPGGPR